MRKRNRDTNFKIKSKLKDSITGWIDKGDKKPIPFSITVSGARTRVYPVDFAYVELQWFVFNQYGFQIGIKFHRWTVADLLS